jgi:uncharacterized protein
MTNLPDFDGASRYAFELLERELPAFLTYHSLAHTVNEVLPAAERLAALEGIRGEELILLRTAAAYHDVGYVERHDDHEAASITILQEVLPAYGYTPEQLAVIRSIVMATRLPQQPRTLIEEILADADLDGLGRDDFFRRNEDLRAELAVVFGPVTDEKWYAAQVEFMVAHHYWTPSERALRDAAKSANLAAVIRLLDGCRSSPGNAR